MYHSLMTVTLKSGKLPTYNECPLSV